MANVKPYGPIWGLNSNWYVCFFVSWQSEHFWLRYSKFNIWPWKLRVMAKVTPDDPIWGLAINRFVCFLFSWQSNHFWLRYSKFVIWPWKFKVKVMAKVKSDDPIWYVAFNRYVCFSFCDNRTIFGWDIANSIFYLEVPFPKTHLKFYKKKLLKKGFQNNFSKMKSSGQHDKGDIPTKCGLKKLASGVFLKSWRNSGGGRGGNGPKQ